MDKTNMFVIIIIIVFISLISGCSSSDKKPEFNRVREGYLNQTKPTPDERRQGNMTEEQNQEIPEEMQQNLKMACEGKSEGESCQLQGQFEEVEGICSNINGGLICKLDRPMGQMEDERK